MNWSPPKPSSPSPLTQNENPAALSHSGVPWMLLVKKTLLCVLVELEMGRPADLPLDDLGPALLLGRLEPKLVHRGDQPPPLEEMGAERRLSRASEMNMTVSRRS